MPSSIGSSVDAGNRENFSDLLRQGLNADETDLDCLFNAAAQKYNVPLNLLKAVAQVESNFSPNATSGCGAMGIMQLMPGTAQSLGVSNAYDPEQNIMGGAKLLSQLLKRFDGNYELTLAAYNAGPGNVEKYNGIPPFSETQNYVRRVIGLCSKDITAGTVSSSSAEEPAQEELLASLTNNAGINNLSTNFLLSIVQSLQAQMYLKCRDNLELITRRTDRSKDEYL